MQEAMDDFFWASGHAFPGTIPRLSPHVTPRGMFGIWHVVPKHQSHKAANKQTLHLQCSGPIASSCYTLRHVMFPAVPIRILPLDCPNSESMRGQWLEGLECQGLRQIPALNTQNSNLLWKMQT